MTPTVRITADSAFFFDEWQTTAVLAVIDTNMRYLVVCPVGADEAGALVPQHSMSFRVMKDDIESTGLARLANRELADR